MNETARLIARVLHAERQNHEGFDAQVQAIDNVALHFATALRDGERYWRWPRAALVRRDVAWLTERLVETA